MIKIGFDEIKAQIDQLPHWEIFNEEEEPLTLDDVQSDTTLISILEVTGLRFTSTSFLLEFCLRQVMVLADKPVFDKCLIKLQDIRK